MSYIYRKNDIRKVEELLKFFPVTAILGPRQSGKTTISKEFKADHYYDLENPRDLAMFENPQLLLEDLEGLIVIDEIQRKTEIFPESHPNQGGWGVRKERQAVSASRNARRPNKKEDF